MSETIALTNSNVSGGMIIKLQKKGKHNPVLEATILFNALTEHLPGGTMTELYRQFVKSSRLFDPAAPDLLAVAEKTDELIQMFVGINSPDEPYLVYSLPREVQDMIFELTAITHAAIATAKGK